jgi:thiamine biosynthesis lipoprotein
MAASDLKAEPSMTAAAGQPTPPNVTAGSSMTAAAWTAAAGTAAAGMTAAGMTAPTTSLPRAVDRSRAMGGGLGIHVAVARDADIPAAEVDAARVAARVRAWAARLTRHDLSSDLMRANADPRGAVPVRPTLAAALRWAADASEMSGGIVDATMLRERLAAEAPAPLVPPTFAPPPADPRGWSSALSSRPRSRPTWRFEPSRHRSAILHRDPGTAFDLDGVAKGWIADRALALLDRHPGALVDADGDIAIRTAQGDSWEVSVADPRAPGAELAVFVLPGARLGARYGVATSGISIHRWTAPDGERHHLIDPRTGLPAATDIVQATVLAGSASAAEAWAKTAVVLGLVAALDVLDRAPVLGAILLASDGRVLAVPRTTRWLA